MSLKLVHKYVINKIINLFLCFLCFIYALKFTIIYILFLFYLNLKIDTINSLL